MPTKLTVEELLLLQKWADEKERVATESYWKIKNDEEKKSRQEGRIGVYRGLSKKLGKMLSEIEA